MIKKILLCSDGSAHSIAAADYARYLGEALGAAVTALHVLDTREKRMIFLADVGAALGANTYQALYPKLEKVMSEKGEVILRDIEERFAGSRAPITTKIEKGHLLTTILRNETDCDLVVIGKKGEAEKDADSVIGSSVEWIVRRSIKPCLLVVPKPAISLERVLIAFDGSAHAEKALRVALGIVKGFAGELLVIAVAPDAEHAEPARKNLLAAEAIAEDYGVTPISLLRTGRPADTIMRYVHKKKADLLVTGAYGHTLLREYLIGSTTFQLLLQADVPVLMIR